MASLAGPVLSAGCADASPIRVTSAADSGAGTLRDAIERANREPGSKIEVAVRKGSQIVIASQLPPLVSTGTIVDGNDVTLREGEGCLRPGGKEGCDGLVVAGPGITIRNLRVAGFTLVRSVTGHAYGNRLRDSCALAV